MSIKIMSWVLDHSPYEGKARLIHVVLADHANDDGVCWPSQVKIAKRSGCSVEHVRVTVKQMVKDQYVEITSVSKGSGNAQKYLLKNPKSVGVSGLEVPQVDGQVPQVGGTSTPNPPPNNHQEPSRIIKCAYCKVTVKEGKIHNCSASGMKIKW